MKYIIVTGLVLASFIGGIYFENNRLAGEPDNTIAVMISKQAIENSSYQLKENAEYLSLIQSIAYEELEKRIKSNNELLSEIKQFAESVCNQVQCSSEQKAYIARIKKKW